VRSVRPARPSFRRRGARLNRTGSLNPGLLVSKRTAKLRSPKLRPSIMMRPRLVKAQIRRPKQLFPSCTPSSGRGGRRFESSRSDHYFAYATVFMGYFPFIWDLVPRIVPRGSKNFGERRRTHLTRPQSPRRWNSHTPPRAGEILVTEAVHDRVSSALEQSSARIHTLKGFENPIAFWAA
jgi:hypothetical protein